MSAVLHVYNLVINKHNRPVLKSAPLGVLVSLLTTMPLLCAAQPLPSPAPAPAAESGAVRVSAFRFTGKTVPGSDGLQALVSESVGRDLTLAQIEALAARVTAWYGARVSPGPRARARAGHRGRGGRDRGVRGPDRRRGGHRRAAIRPRIPSGSRAARPQSAGLPGAGLRAQPPRAQRPPRARGEEHLEPGGHPRHHRRTARRGKRASDHRRRRGQQLRLEGDGLRALRPRSQSQQSLRVERHRSGSAGLSRGKATPSGSPAGPTAWRSATGAPGSPSPTRTSTRRPTWWR